MDKITDLFQGLKERFNNPLFGSFIIAWLIINWQVPIGIIFYGNETLAKDGYKSKIDLIHRLYSQRYFIWLPLVSAVIYTFGFPILKNWIRFFYVWANKWGTDRSLIIANNGAIPISKYFSLREDYTERTKYLQEVIKSESSYIEENKEINQRILQLQNEKNELQFRTSELNERNNLLTLNGFWKIKHKRALNGNEFHERVMISNGEIYRIDKNSASDILFRITSCAFNPLTTDFIFILEEPLSKKVFFTILRPIENGKMKKLRSLTDGLINEMERE